MRGKPVTKFNFKLKKENCNVFIDVWKIDELDLRSKMARVVVDASTGVREGARREVDRVRHAVAVPRLCLNRAGRVGGEWWRELELLCQWWTSSARTRAEVMDQGWTEEERGTR
jgi:hypothetical protein